MGLMKIFWKVFLHFVLRYRVKLLFLHSISGRNHYSWDMV